MEISSRGLQGKLSLGNAELSPAQAAALMELHLKSWGFGAPDSLGASSKHVSSSQGQAPAQGLGADGINGNAEKQGGHNPAGLSAGDKPVLSPQN